MYNSYSLFLDFGGRYRILSDFVELRGVRRSSWDLIGLRWALSETLLNAVNVNVSSCTR